MRIVQNYWIILALVLITAPLLASNDPLEVKILEKAEIRQLEIRQEGNQVILEGQAVLLEDKIEAGKLARRELKQEIVNRIVLLPVKKSDEEISMEIAARFRKKASRNNIFNDISVQTRNGDVVLTGRVRNAYLADRAEEAAMEVAGVQSVHNRIEILPVSGHDDRIRANLFRRFRNDTVLSLYFLGAQPSMNIIVDRSRVILTGYVISEVARVRAEHLARQFPGVLGVENQIQVVKGT